MSQSQNTVPSISFRPISSGMGLAIAERTVLRKKENGEWETWLDVATRVARGNSLLFDGSIHSSEAEYLLLRKHIANGNTLMSGRHLQHGDETQPNRNMECFTNCSTASSSFLLFYLLLNGSGVGRCYDDDMMLVNWDNAPNLRCVLDSSHPDFNQSAHECVRDARHKYGKEGPNVMWYEIPDSREGWAKGLEIWENAAFEKIHAEKMLILDFSKVRAKGLPIKGMQNRPASGPVALMDAFNKAASLKGAGLSPWKQAMYLDHYFAECVLVGGARRCIAEGQRVLVKNAGFKAIENVSIGDLVSTPNGWKPVTATFNQGEQETITVIYKNGKLVCTPNHRVAILTGVDSYEWKLASELSVGDRLFWIPTIDEGGLTHLPSDDYVRSPHATTLMDIIIPALDIDVAWLIGLIHGDGYVELTDTHGNIRISQDKEYENIALRAADVLSRFGVKAVISDVGNMKQVRVSSKSLASYFFKHIKQPNTLLKIPNFIKSASPEIRAAYLQGVMDSDGCTKNRPQKLVTSIYFSWVEDLQALAASIGVMLRLNESEPKGEGWKPQRSLNFINNCNKIQFSTLTSGAKALTTNEHRGHQDSYPCKFVTKAIFERKLTYSDIKGRIATNNNSSYDAWKNNTLISTCYYPQEVIAISGGMPSKTYDLEVADGNCFVCQGVLVHNSARMSTKHWSDSTSFDFITIKRPLEFHGKDTFQILDFRKNNHPNAFLWSSNNSVTVDDEFWTLVKNPKDKTPRAKHAKKVFKMVCSAAYADGTGEPGFINSHLLVQKDDGWNDLNRGDYVGSKKYQINDDTQILMSRLAKRAKKKKYHTIVNPCGEIPLNVLGGFCCLADVVPFHANTIEEAEEAFRVSTRALMRVNLMDSIYSKEVQRTNRIGVGITGVHEFAYKFFGFGFKDLIDEEKSKPFWMQMARFNNIVYEEAQSYAKELGVKPPHTITTVKPSGSVSKLFGLTEGWHLPSMEYFLRWVQFSNDDPLVEVYKKAGYPVRKLTQYTNTTIVGFPTEPTITTLGMGDKLVTAANATPEEQFKWLMLGEKYWICGVTPDGKPVEDIYGGQISYTLKYKPNLTDFDHFKKMILKYQSQVRCCSIMPQEDTSSYEYQPEESISEKKFSSIVEKIQAAKLTEDIGREHIGCDTGVCPVDFNSGKK
jgi:intein/homing endonuclease